MATKKEGAQRLLDTLESKKKLKPRLMFALGQAFAVSACIWYFSGFWQFAVAAILVFGLLIQFALERMSNSIEASRIQAISDLGWKEQHLSDDEYRTRIEKILGQ